MSTNVIVSKEIGKVTYTEEEVQVYKKVIWKLIPFLCFCYIAAYLDRINVGLAKLHMLSDVHLSEAAFGLGAGLFFVGYIIFEVPSNLVMEKVGAKVWIARIMITWGILSGLTMFVTTPMQFYILRFLLGAAEAGFLPGVLYYLTTWFPTYYRGKIIALFLIGLPLAVIIGSPLSGWIMQTFDSVHGLAGWQWLFFLEAIPSVLLGILTLKVLPNHFSKAKWLNEQEKSIIENNLKKDLEGNTSAKEKHSFKDGFFNLNVLKLGVINFSMLLCTYSMGFWLPTFIKSAGMDNLLHIGFVVAIPSVIGLIAMLLIGRSSDKYRERRWHLIIPFVFGSIALFLTHMFSGNITMTVVLFSIAAIATTGTIPVFFSLPATFLSGTAAATGFALACSIANLAGLVSNTLVGYAIQITGKPEGALMVFAGFLLLSCLIVLSLPKSLVNK
ncbi:MFS transporter [Acinetobacter sichuanensis]|uniref:MFS transporter n=1 Tax=Acinetobacter sichuanensis TaxID=2136183 RepID=A0A371YM64_9GAMM|nr:MULTISPECIES: MFS transporter [Acinetobacter]MDM1768016.1 MFS transporter [Acinetobacter sp. 226-4]RFC82577.1 MFS transporter [Acinetobacter sichuanensis]